MSFHMQPILFHNNHHIGPEKSSILSQTSILSPALYPGLPLSCYALKDDSNHFIFLLTSLWCEDYRDLSHAWFMWRLGFPCSKSKNNCAKLPENSTLLCQQMMTCTEALTLNKLKPRKKMYKLFIQTPHVTGNFSPTQEIQVHWP